VPVFSDWVLGVYSFFVNLPLGALLLLAFPRFSRRVADSAFEGPGRAGAAGFMILVGVPVLLVLTAITIIGIPLAVVGAMVFGVLVWVGAVYGRIAVGTWLTPLPRSRAAGPPSSSGSRSWQSWSGARSWAGSRNCSSLPPSYRRSSSS
jgi:hypothetical protein